VSRHSSLSALGRSGRVTVTALAGAPRRDGIVDLDGLLAALGPADLLESADRSGWTSLVPHDLAPAVLHDDGRRTTLRGADGSSVDLGADPLAALDAVARQLGLDPTATPDPGLSVPFRGGLVGALAYELGDRIEPRLARRRRAEGQPDLMLRVAGTVVAVTRERDHAFVVVDEGIQGRPAGDVHAELEQRCRSARTRSGRVGDAVDDTHLAVVATSLPHDEHAAAVREVLAVIGRGDAYQVNLAQQLAAPFVGDLGVLYRRLRAASPASHAALLPDAGLASISPERFLDVSAGIVTTDPIKGTRRRADDPELDAALADDLTTSAKDRAENIMVVDLERNDLGRVCVTGSVHVPTLLELRALPTVWHLVSRVRGTLRPGTTYGDLLRATFPSGSVTGAPRLAAMHTIRDLEPVPRGWYCGAVGWLGRGSASLSVAIRTATLRDGIAVYGAGGGIVADSDPDDEVAESLDKAVAFLAAVGATHTTRRTRDRIVAVPGAASTRTGRGSR
jgi:para-aminobenzoate synthetase component I